MSLPLPKQLEDELNSVPRYKPEKFSIEKFLQNSPESLMFDEIFGGGQKKPVSKPSSSAASEGGTSSSSEFTTLLAGRLAGVEQENKELRRQLAMSSKHVIQLTEERQHLNELLEQSTDSASLVRKVKSENVHLHKQLMEMEKFLADYGLVWVGNSDRSVKETETDESAKQQDIDYDLFVQKVAELNSIIMSEPTQVVTQTDGNIRRARLAHPEEVFDNINVTIYSNGIMVKRGPFRPINSDSYNSFVCDIIDGYFPSEFRNEAPEGVILKLQDKRSEAYSADGTSSSRAAMKESHFLNRLPKTIVRDGHIISVRGDIESKLSGDAKSDGKGTLTTSCSEPKLGVNCGAGGGKSHMRADSGKRVHNVKTYAQQSIDAACAGDGELVDDICTVQVKWPNGQDVFVLKMFASDLIDDLKSALHRHIMKCSRDGDSLFEDYDADLLLRMSIRNSHPPRALASDMSLRNAYLYPNGTVHVQIANKVELV
jgi:hypothetical protein